MQITEVRIKLMEEDSQERLKAFCSITFDDAFVVRDLKIIEGANGLFVAMPSRKLTARCPFCGCKNHLRANHCNQCGKRLGEARIVRDDDGRAKLYADIAHPINSSCRDAIQKRVLEEFQLELERSKLEGYVSRYDDWDLDSDFELPAGMDAPAASQGARPYVEGPQFEPRPPHLSGAGRRLEQPARAGSETLPVESDSPSTDSPPKSPPKGSFGAGIFDE